MRSAIVLLFLIGPLLLAQQLMAVTPQVVDGKKLSGEPTPTPVVMSALRTVGCNVSFSLPAGWRVEVLKEDEDSPPPSACSLGLLPPNYSEVVASSEIEHDEYPITVFVSSNGVEQAASKGGFINLDGEWRVEGRGGSNATSRVEGADWYGFLGMPAIGSHYKTGGYAGLADTQRVLLIGPGNLCAVLDATDEWDVFGDVLESFRFVKLREP